LAYSLTLKIEAAHSSEIRANFYQFTQHHIPEVSILEHHIPEVSILEHHIPEVSILEVKIGP
jgi:hypothetical protein